MKQIKKICLVGFETLLRENKTGVGICQKQVVEELVKRKVNFKLAIAGDDVDSITLAKRPHNRWLKPYIKVGRVIKKNRYSEKIPVELRFGYFPVYLMNDIMYPSILPCKKIAWVHDMMSAIYPQYYSEDSLKQHRIIVHNAKYIDECIATSKTTKQDVVKYLHVKHERIHVAYNGVEKEFFQNANIKSLPESQIDFNKDFYLYIGDMRKNKNLLNALKGFEKYLSQTNADVYFYIAGNKSREYANLKKYVDESERLRERVCFLGYVADDEKMALYRRAKALLFVSEYEGFGIPVLEAMASKTPVVTSNCSSMGEIAKGAAVLVNPFDIQDIADGLKTLDKQQFREELIAKGESRAKRFTWDRVTEKFCKVLGVS